MKRRFLLLHGLGNHRPIGHWLSWLAEELRRRDEQVLYPQMPSPDAPKLPEWLDLLCAENAQMGAGERIVVCHSLACALWYWASEGGELERPADRVLLVAPPGPSVLERAITATFYAGAWNGERLSASSRTKIRLVASQFDPECPEGSPAQVYGQPLGLDAETIPGAGHLSMSDGYGPWPAVLRWCLDGSVRLSADDSHQVAHTEDQGSGPASAYP